VATHVAFYYAVMLAPRCDSGALRLKLGYDCIGAGGATGLGLRLAHPKTPTLTMLVLPIAERSNRKIRDLGLMCWTGWARASTTWLQVAKLILIAAVFSRTLPGAQVWTLCRKALVCNMCPVGPIWLLM